jgi:hypothetical protein
MTLTQHSSYTHLKRGTALCPETACSSSDYQMMGKVHESATRHHQNLRETSVFLHNINRLVLVIQT